MLPCNTSVLHRVVFSCLSVFYRVVLRPYVTTTSYMTGSADLLVIVSIIHFWQGCLLFKCANSSYNQCQKKSYFVLHFCVVHRIFLYKILLVLTLVCVVTFLHVLCSIVITKNVTFEKGVVNISTVLLSDRQHFFRKENTIREPRFREVADTV